MKKNLYETLGVGKNASKGEIKSRYRKMAKRFHPDCGGDTEKFKNICDAYKTLIDDDLRFHYDATGETERVDEGHILKTAMNMISSTFIGMFENDKSNDIDYLGSIRVSCTSSMKEAIKLIKNIKVEIIRWKKIKKRVKYKGKMIDFIQDSLDAKVRELNGRISTEETLIEVMEKVLELLKDYELLPPEELLLKMIEEEKSIFFDEEPQRRVRNR